MEILEATAGSNDGGALIREHSANNDVSLSETQSVSNGKFTRYLAIQLHQKQPNLLRSA